MKAILIAALCLMVSSSFAASYEEIEDRSELLLLNLDLQERKTAKIRLPNGLEALLISDPKADQSAAALAVNVGSWDNPDEYPGMAHFCEHMLFMGTSRFPSENEFSSRVADYNGMRNAYTASDRTVYMFSCGHDGFSPLLERFSRFFIDPLFNPSGISRELHAVDQEFFKNIENDAWREYMIFKEMGNPDHPNVKFSSGNSQTLASIPQSALKEWHAAHYSAEKMRLVLYAPTPLEQLAQEAADLFASVPVAKKTAPLTESEITSSSQRGHLILIQPIKQRQALTLCWEIPSHLSLNPSRPAHLYSYALSRGQPHSLYELLKKEGLIEDASFSIEEVGGVAHSLFQIDLLLTDKGLAEWKSAALHCFQAIQRCRSGLPPFLFQEMNAIAAMKYQYQSRQSAFSFAMRLADALLDEDLATFPRSNLLASSFDPQALSELGQWLTPGNCLFTLVADSAKAKWIPDQKERWMGGEYAIREISDTQLLAWQNAMPHPDIRLPNPNPFIPASFAILGQEGQQANPIQIAQDDYGCAYYARAPEFQSPEASFSLHLLSPKICGGAKQESLAALYLDLLETHLHPLLSAASDAGLQASFNYSRSRIHLQINGFNDKASFLLQEILKKIGSPLDATKEEFEACKSKHKKKYANGAFDLPCIQAKELALSLIDSDKKTRKEKLFALEKIGYAEFLSFSRSLFEESYAEALFAGNLSLKDAEAAWLDVRHLIGSKPFLSKRHPHPKILALSGSGPFAVSESTDTLGNATLLLLDQGTFTFERRAAQQILSASLSDAFFNTLRTKQKTGYIVQSDDLEMELRLFQYFLVQSSSHEPDELLQRFELFLETQLQKLPEAISEERFALLKENGMQFLRTQGQRNLQEKSALLDKLAFERDADFEWVDQCLQGFKTLTYTAFLQEAQKFLSRENKRRLAILLDGKKKNRFSYEPVSQDLIRKNERYLTRSEALQEG